MFQQQLINIPEFAGTSPLSWWRSAPAHSLSVREANRVRRELRRVALYGEPAWKDAVHGDAAAAIGVAIRIAVRQPCMDALLDMAMSPVLVAAIEGDAAARLFMSHILTKRVPVDEGAKVLAASWLEANRVAAQTAKSAKSAPLMRPPRRRRVMSCARR